MSRAMRIDPPVGYRVPEARPAATLMMLRQGPPLEVFMQLRHESMAFAPGYFVFPGGRMEKDDAVPRFKALSRGLERLGPEQAGLVIAAIRETFEECGVLYAREAGSERLIGGARWAALAGSRAAVSRGTLGFADLIEAEGLELAADLIKPFARWETPWWHRRRYDTYFFAAPAPEAQIPDHDGSEAVESIWLKAKPDAIEALTQERLLPPTQRSLQYLAELGSLERALSQPEEEALRLIRPWLERRAQGYVLMHEMRPGAPPLETAIPRLARLGIPKELAAAIAADLESRGWRG